MVVIETQNLLRLLATPGAQNSGGPGNERYSADCKSRIDFWGADRSGRWGLTVPGLVVTEQNLPNALGMCAGARTENQSQCQKGVLQEFRQCSHSLSMICTAGIAIAKCSGLRLRLYLAAYPWRSNKRRMLYIRNPIWNKNWIRSPVSLLFCGLGCQTTYIWGGVDVLRIRSCRMRQPISRKGVADLAYSFSASDRLLEDCGNFEMARPG